MKYRLEPAPSAVTSQLYQEIFRTACWAAATLSIQHGLFYNALEADNFLVSIPKQVMGPSDVLGFQRAATRVINLIPEKYWRTFVRVALSD